MGHDVRAALVTAMLRALVEDLSAKAAEPASCWQNSIRPCSRSSGRRHHHVCHGILSGCGRGRGQLAYASAAHPDSLRLKRPPAQWKCWPRCGGKKGPALGLFRDSKFPTCQRPLNAGICWCYTPTDSSRKKAGRRNFWPGAAVPNPRESGRAATEGIARSHARGDSSLRRTPGILRRCLSARGRSQRTQIEHRSGLMAWSLFALSGCIVR